MTDQLDTIVELKKLIDIELKECKVDLWPGVCKMQSTQQGKTRLHEMIIRYAAEGMPIGSAIALIEQELAHQEE